MKPRVKVKVQFGRGPKAEPAPEPPRVTRVARLLALAWWIDERTRAGEIKDLAEAARELGLTRARMTQVMNLRLLAPEAQEVVLEGIAVAERTLRDLLREPAWQARPTALLGHPERAPARSGRTGSRGSH